MERKALFTPGPLSTSVETKNAMLVDVGSRTPEFINIIRETRVMLLEIAGVTARSYQAILMQGSGTYALEAYVRSCMNEDTILLVLVNGEYGRRFAKIARDCGANTHVLTFRDTERIDPEKVKEFLTNRPDITHVHAVHCETTTGIINDVAAIGQLVHETAERIFSVDAMSSLGAVPLALYGMHIDALISSANKCIEGVPGIAFVIASTPLLERTGYGFMHSTVLDLHEQLQYMNETGQFRFTPPTHVILALHEALTALKKESVIGRHDRYARNARMIVDAFKSLGFETYLDESLLSNIITTFKFPTDTFDFYAYYEHLEQNGIILYPGKVTNEDTFRIGHIGQISYTDIQLLTKLSYNYLKRGNREVLS